MNGGAEYKAKKEEEEKKTDKKKKKKKKHGEKNNNTYLKFVPSYELVKKKLHIPTKE